MLTWMLALLRFNKSSKKSQNITITPSVLAPLILPTKSIMTPPPVVRMYANFNQIKEIKENPLIAKYIIETQKSIS